MQEEAAKLLEEVAADGRTVFLSSHVLPEVERMCHDVAIIRAGQIVAVEDIAQLKGRSAHIIEITFATPPPARLFEIPGVHVVSRDGATVRLQAQGDLDAIVKAAATQRVLDFRTEQPSLEDIFLSYYQATRARSQPSRRCSVRAPSVFAKSLRDQRWQILGFGVTLALVAALDVLLWPSYRDTLQNLQIPPALQALLGTDLSLATPAGFLSSEFFSWTPVLLIVCAVIQGTGAVAGEESAGTLELLLAQPVPRSSVLVQKAAAVCIGAVLILAIAFCGFALTVPFVAIDVTLVDVGAGVLNMLPITLLFFGLALWLGAYAPSRGLASAIAVGVATAAYVLNTFAVGIDALRGLRWATPFYYYGSGLPLVDGIRWWHFGLLAGVAAGFFALSLWAFARRDIGTAGGSDVDVVGGLRRLLQNDRTAA